MSAVERLSLDDYQIEAIEKMSIGSILCGGVGSGKSRTSLGYYYIFCGGKLIGVEGSSVQARPKRFIPLYIITTARKRDDKEWLGELKPYNINPNDVVIDSWNNIQKYKKEKNAFFIFDEQRVVGSGAWVKSFLEIAKRNDWILLSATPGDTWSDYIPVFVANGFYKNKTDFERQHAVYSRYSNFPKIERYVNTGKLIRYKREILVKMNYHNANEPRTEIIFCDYDKDKYKLAFKDRWDPFDNIPIQNASCLFYIIRKIVNTDPSRIEHVKAIQEKHKKIIVFYNFNYELDILRSATYGDAIIAEWNGQKHEPIPDSDEWVYLVQYTAGAEGWNCIKTNVIVFYSQNYSYKVMVQAAGRIDRRNTPFDILYYYRLKSKAPIDTAISKALNQKKSFNENTYLRKIEKNAPITGLIMEREEGKGILTS